MGLEANKSFYDGMLKIAGLFFGFAIFLLLREPDVRSIYFLLNVTLGLTLVSYLIYRKNSAASQGERLFLLNRSNGHIVVDAISEACRTCVFALAIHLIRSGDTFYEGTKLTLPAFVLAAVLATYVVTMIYYSNKARRERDQWLAANPA